jgi:hypothetical protein
MFGSILCAELDNEPTQISEQVVILSQDEIDAILRRDELYVYFGPEVCSAIHDLPYIHRYILAQDLPCQYLSTLCDYISHGKTTASFDLVDAALYEAAEYLASNQIEITQEDAAQLFRNLEEYCAKLEAGAVDLVVSPTEDEDVDTTTVRSRRCKAFHSLITCKLSTTCLNVKCNATIGGNLTVFGNELIEGDLTVLGTINGGGTTPMVPGVLEIVGTPQQACIIFLDAALVEKARICTSTIPGDNGLFVSVDGGVTQNLRVNNEGGTVLAAPTSGAALAVTGNAGASAIVATGNGTTAAPALTLIGNPASTPTDFLLTIDAGGVVRESTITTTNFIVNGCQPGPLTIGTSDATSLTFATNGCTPRMTIDADGAVVILMPTAGEALTVNGNIVVPAANAAETQGIVQLGGATIKLYEFGTRNFFAGSGVINSSVTGVDNIGIGTTANSGLTAGNNTIAIGTTAQAVATDSIAIGDAANATAARTIVLGSRDSTSAGAAPTATNVNAIAIGSASGANAGATASGIAAIAVGGADGATFVGAQATGARSIALGVNATANSSASIAIGSASGTAGGNAPIASNIGSIAIGSGFLANAGAMATGISSVAIGAADGTSAVSSVLPGAVASGDRSVAIGVNAMATAAQTIAVGSAGSVITGLAASASNSSAIAIGAGSGAVAGASATGIAAVAIGSASGAVAGAVASGDRSVAIGNGANTAQADAILLGNAGATAVRVGIGTAAPIAKLDIVGVNLTPVLRFDQVNTAIGNAPVWLNPSVSAVAGTPIHYNASNQLFGFTSSERYKTNIRPITTESEIIYQLNPVLYDPKEGYGEGQDIPGFIAEDVNLISPNLVIFNGDNQPENVAYNSFHALAIKEIQKHQQLLESQNAIITAQSSVIDALLVTIGELQTTMSQLEASA